ncbi:PREDICTED: NLR family CARD domain-containing protein 4-like isoform X1 [Branchiostoma belcheri]|uniref:NLR family CARD domain-containing protein 4-like isoform X1 n=1 Tax=Branchiostoma belcheri TaxID=7741 RepID=A0A6P4ZSF8_BRABE|nr:PREDICTED: NLR family CARD domain-containing protein 4-like isoform X1 [Branchiostoma belcheri]
MRRQLPIGIGQSRETLQKRRKSLDSRTCPVEPSGQSRTVIMEESPCLQQTSDKCHPVLLSPSLKIEAEVSSDSGAEVHSDEQEEGGQCLSPKSLASHSSYASLASISPMPSGVDLKSLLDDSFPHSPNASLGQEFIEHTDSSSKPPRRAIDILIGGERFVLGQSSADTSPHSPFRTYADKGDVPSATLDTSIHDLRDELAKLYIKNMQQITPLPWNNKFLVDVRDVSLHYEVLQEGKRPGDMHRVRLKRFEDVFESKGLPGPRRIFFQCIPGVRKATLLNKVPVEWSRGRWMFLVERFQLLFSINLLDVSAEDTLWDTLRSQFPQPLASASIDSVKAFLLDEETQWSTLFLIDGYDERADINGDIRKLIQGRLFPDSCVIVFARPVHYPDLMQWMDTRVEISGFSIRSAYRLLHNYFPDNPHKAAGLIAALKQYENVTAVDVKRTSLHIWLLCVLWDDNPKKPFPETMTRLYSEFLSCVIRHHKELTREDVDVEAVLNPVGKIAMDGLLGKKAIFNLRDLEPIQDGINLLLELGILRSGSKSLDIMAPSSLLFSHTTMQEFVAGRYLATQLPQDGPHEHLPFNTVKDALALENVILFACGTAAIAGKVILSHLAKIYADELQEHEEAYYHEQLPTAEFEEFRSFVVLCLRCLYESPIRKELCQSCMLDFLSRRVRLDWMGVPSQESVALQCFLCLTATEGPKSAVTDLTLSFHDYSLKKPEYLFNILHYVPHLKNLTVHLGSCLEKECEDLSLLDQPLGCLRELCSVHITGDARRFTGLSFAFLKPSESFTSITMQDVQLGGRLARVAANFKYLPCLTTLKLQDCGLSGEDVTAMSEYLYHVPLEELDVSFNELGNELSSLVNKLVDLPSLRILSLCDVSPTFSTIEAIGKALKHMNQLEELYLAQNEVDAWNYRGCWEDLVQNVCYLPKLRVVDVSRCLIGSHNIALLIKSLIQTMVQVINIAYNEATNETMEAIEENLVQLPYLKTLNVSGNEISFHGIYYFGKALHQARNLTNLNVSYNELADVAVADLAGRLHQVAGTLRSLDISSNPITEEGLKNFASSMEPMLALRQLNMSGAGWQSFHLSNEAALVIAQLLGRLPSLVRLELRWITMQQDGFQAVVRAAMKHPKLQELWYCREKVPRGTEALVVEAKKLLHFEDAN